MDSSTICQNEQRRKDVGPSGLNGIDSVEVGDDQRTLTVFFFRSAPEALEKENVQIEGGAKVRNIHAVELRVCINDDAERTDCIDVTVDRPGDFGTYTLKLVDAEQGHPTPRPLRGFDPRYAQANFSFQAGMPTGLDCQNDTVSPAVTRQEPEINYLAKDYASFRQLILDRLALIMPDWKERHEADLGMVLVEILAYVGDYLGYYQDAVATEAYLNTARQRISVRRHARLVDYQIHEGCNARAWLAMETKHDIDPPIKPETFYFITSIGDTLPFSNQPLTSEDLRRVPLGRYEVFEPVCADAIQWYESHNRISFYTWGNRVCSLPVGATSATLKDQWRYPAGQEHLADNTSENAPSENKNQGSTQCTPDIPPHSLPSRALRMQKGDILIFEEILGPRTGNAADADPAHRHAVRLTRVEREVDEVYKTGTPLLGQPVLVIEWSEEDALPFALPISVIGPPSLCNYIGPALDTATSQDISIARGNVILVDHGRRIEKEALEGEVPLLLTEEYCAGEGMLGKHVMKSGRFNPRLSEPVLTFRQSHQKDASAAQQMIQDPRRALPHIFSLISNHEPKMSDPVWIGQGDLLGSDARSQDYVAEIDNEGYAHLRFGDGINGRMPPAGATFQATYRVGNGLVGNVGAETITHLVMRSEADQAPDVTVRNPMKAQGGLPAESLSEAKVYASSSFRRDIERAITTEDYARLAERHPKVQRAVSTALWTGARLLIRIAIDPLHKQIADEALLENVKRSLYPYRRIGHDLEVVPAAYVALDLQMKITVRSQYLRAHVESALLVLFSAHVLPDGRLAFFHPDNLTFGENVYISKIVAVAQMVIGVESVMVTKLERLFEGPQGELEKGVLALHPLEVARLDNDLAHPEYGQLQVDLWGGR